MKYATRDEYWKHASDIAKSILQQCLYEVQFLKNFRHKCIQRVQTPEGEGDITERVEREFNSKKAQTIGNKLISEVQGQQFEKHAAKMFKFYAMEDPLLCVHCQNTPQNLYVSKLCFEGRQEIRNAVFAKKGQTAVEKLYKASLKA